MKTQRIHSGIWISPRVYLYLALLLLIVPVRWIGACVAAAAIHELGHICAVVLLGIPLEKIRIEINGAVIETGNMSAAQELICALAGPAAGMLLVLSMRHFPAVALCAFVQSVYNLLPISPLDGGRALECFLSLFLSERGMRKTADFIAVAFLAALFLLAAVLTFKKNLGLLPLIAVCLIAGKYIRQKNSLQRCPGQCTIEPLQK